MIDWTKVTAFDFETSGTLPEYALQPWRVKTGDAWITSLATIRPAGSSYVKGGSLSPSKEHLTELLTQAQATGGYIVGWNTVFDISWLLAMGLRDDVFKCKWLDGMLLWRHLEIEPEYDTVKGKKRSFGLKSAVAEFIPQHAGYEANVDFHATDADSLAALHEYNVQDTLFTFLIARGLFAQLSPRQQNAALIEAEILPFLAEANLEGMLVDTLAANELATNLENIAHARLEELTPHGVTESVVRSPKQLAALMFGDGGGWQLTPHKQTASGANATDKEALHELALVDPRARLLREYREALNNRKKFADTPLESVAYNGDHRTHPSAIPFGTYSGRVTYSSSQGANKAKRQTGFALHQEKRGAEYRAILIPPPGYTLVEFDAAGQEYRWMAIASKDPTMLSLCQAGQDPHSFMGAAIAEVDYHELVGSVRSGDKVAKERRQLGKVANLSLQYRTSAPKLRTVARVQYGLPMELPEAQKIHRTYLSTYEKVPHYWATAIVRAQKNGYVETFAGRRVSLTDKWNGPLAWSMESTAINYRIQGTGADQKYLALKVIKDYLNYVGGRFAWDLHDGIYLYIPDEVAMEAARTIKDLLDNLPYAEAWGFTPPIPLPWDCKMGGSWGDLREVEFE